MTAVYAFFESPLGCFNALRIRSLWAAPAAIAVLGLYSAYPQPTTTGKQNKAGACADSPAGGMRADAAPQTGRCWRLRRRARSRRERSSSATASCGTSA